MSPQIQVRVPSVPPGPQPVVVTTPAGSSAPMSLEVLPGALPPVLTSVTPASARVGDVVTLAGDNFDGTATVTIGGVNAPVV